MITTGIIREVAVNKGNFTGNAYKVELNIFQIPGDEDKKNYTYVANCAVPGGLYDSYNVDDIVYVSFLNNNKSLPVILGKIYQGLKDESKSIANFKALKVTGSTNLSKNTFIGEIDFSDKKYFFDNVNNVIRDKDLFIDSIQLRTAVENAGLIYFDDNEGTAELSLSPNVKIALGIDAVVKAYNDTYGALIDGQVVYITDNDIAIAPVALAISSIYAQASRVVGIVTEPILSHDYGFISRQGYVGGLLLYEDDDDPNDILSFSLNDALYLSPNNPGKFTKRRPVPPNFLTRVGYVTKLSSGPGVYDGQIYVNIEQIPIAADIIYNNEYIEDEEYQLTSRDAQSAIDELQLRKADIDLLSSDIVLYRTLADSDILGYKKLATSIADPDFPPTTAVRTGIISTTEQYIASAISPSNLFIGNPGQINITSIGRVKKYSGNNNQNANFFFRMYKRTADGTEILLAQSGTTATVISSTEWFSFTAVALLNDGSFLPTDRIVIKSYANYVDNPGGEFEYEFGGVTDPFRVIIPVPVRVIPIPIASGVIVNTANFTGVLNHLDSNAQHALDTLDKHTHLGIPYPGPIDTLLGSRSSDGTLSVTNFINYDEVIIEAINNTLPAEVITARSIVPTGSFTYDTGGIDKTGGCVFGICSSGTFGASVVMNNGTESELLVDILGTSGCTVRIYGRKW